MGNKRRNLLQTKRIQFKKRGKKGKGEGGERNPSPRPGDGAITRCTTTWGEPLSRKE